MNLPPIPESVPSPLGPVPVVFVKNLHTKGPERADALGYFDYTNRVVEIEEDAAHCVQWHTYYHEACHVACWDAGLQNAFTEEQIEIICDVTACQRVAELLTRL